MNKGGGSKIEIMITWIGGVSIAFFFVITLFSSGISTEIIKSFTSAFGAIGALIGILFIIMIILAVFENVKGKK